MSFRYIDESLREILHWYSQQLEKKNDLIDIQEEEDGEKMRKTTLSENEMQTKVDKSLCCYRQGTCAVIDMTCVLLQTKHVYSYRQDIVLFKQVIMLLQISHLLLQTCHCTVTNKSLCCYRHIVMLQTRHVCNYRQVIVQLQTNHCAGINKACVVLIVVVSGK